MPATHRFPRRFAAHQPEQKLTVVLGETGTLTEGKPQLTDVLPVAGMVPTELLRLAASLEQGIEHPLASALVNTAKEQALGLQLIMLTGDNRRTAIVAADGVFAVLCNTLNI